MRRLLSILLFMVAACATPVVQVEPPSTLDPIVEIEGDFINVVRAWSLGMDRLTIVDFLTDDDLIEFGWTVCASYADGMTDDDLIDFLIVEVPDLEMQYDWAVLVGFSSGAFCPWETGA